MCFCSLLPHLTFETTLQTLPSHQPLPTHTNTNAHSHTRSLSPSQNLTHIDTRLQRCVATAPTHSHTHTHTKTCMFYLSVSRSRTHTHTSTDAATAPTQTHTHTRTRSLSPSLSLTHTHTSADAATAPTEPQTPSPGDEHAPATSDEEASVRRGEGQPADMDCRTLQRIPAFLVLPPDFENTCSCELLAYEEMPRELDIRLEIVSPLCPWKPSCCAVAVLMVGGILILFFSTWLGRWIGGDFGDPRCVNRDDGPCAVGIQNGTEVRRWSMGS